MKRWHVEFDIEARNFDEDDKEIPISNEDASSFIKDVVADVATMVEGLDTSWDFMMKIHSINYELDYEEVEK
jgi:hypothetical protein